MIETICVCGAGTMGTGIAQVCAQHGFTTSLFDVNNDVLNSSRMAINDNLQAQVNKGRITNEGKDTILSLIHFISNIQDCRGDIIIEAIIEHAPTKINLFNQLAEFNSTETIFATNTSSIPVNSIAEEVADPTRVVGMHFFNPAPVMKLVEVVQALKTSDEVAAKVYLLASQLGKTPVMCKDVPGFIVNRVARHYYLEAMRLLDAGIADAETIDLLMEATGFKMGPFKLMDLIGLDINYSVSDIVWQKLGKPERLRPSYIQQQKIGSGDLGKKTGKGFYTYRTL